MLQNEYYFFAKIGFDTAEKEPSKVSSLIPTQAITTASPPCSPRPPAEVFEAAGGDEAMQRLKERMPAPRKTTAETYVFSDFWLIFGNL